MDFLNTYKQKATEFLNAAADDDTHEIAKKDERKAKIIDDYKTITMSIRSVFRPELKEEQKDDILKTLEQAQKDTDDDLRLAYTVIAKITQLVRVIYKYS